MNLIPTLLLGLRGMIRIEKNEWWRRGEETGRRRERGEKGERGKEKHEKSRLIPSLFPSPISLLFFSSSISLIFFSSSFLSTSRFYIVKDNTLVFVGMPTADLGFDRGELSKCLPILLAKLKKESINTAG